MSSLNPENSPNQDMNDSGCVQDASVSENGYRGMAHILDLSDDVLLYILQYCTPRDLKALGHTCPRFGILVRDRTLWTQVDARTSPVGELRLRWFLTHCLSNNTTELKIAGYANKYSRCLGIQELHWPLDSGSGCVHGTYIDREEVNMEHFFLRMWYPHLPRQPDGWPCASFAVSPRWPNKSETEYRALQKAQKEKEAAAKGESSTSSQSEPKPDRKPSKFEEMLTKKGNKTYFPSLLEEDIQDDCKGPQFTLTTPLMKDLRRKCSHLTSLALEYCNLDFRATNLLHFPNNLKKLSLRGSICYNLPLNTSFLGKVQERLPYLEYLDVSECDWFEPASLMPLSKLVNLNELYMRDCKRLTECVAYASLATRYGFRKLRVVDVRGSPLADSEVSALGWLPRLEELYVSPPEELSDMTEHTHSWNDSAVVFTELDAWEMEEPDYYKNRSPEPSEADEEEEQKEYECRYVQERAEDVLLGNPWWSHERRIIVIQPNATRAFDDDPLPGDAPDQPPAGPNVPQGGPRDPPQNPQPHPEPHEPQPGPANAEPGPSKRRANEDAIDLAKRPRIQIGQEEPVDLPIPIYPVHCSLDNLGDQCPRLRRGPDPAPRCVQFRRGNLHPVMHIDVDIHRQPNIELGSHLGYHLVSDAAILRFGRAENENVSYVHIGRNGVHAGAENGARPDRSNLRILSVTGYRNITDRSLEHLATAAPYLLHIDFTDTHVSARGVEVFKAMRPNCDVIFSEFGSSA